ANDDGKHSLPAQEDVRRASDRYYAALSRLLEGDAGPLMDVWSHGADVTALNPYGGRETGWERLRTVFERVAAYCAGSRVAVRLDDALIRVGGDLAYQVGVERVDGIIAGQPSAVCHRVTNIYRREGDTWRLVHRHTDLNAAEQEAARFLQPA